MFPNIGDLMAKAGALKQNLEDSKNRLDSEYFIARDSEKLVALTLSKFATVKDLEISDELMDDKEALQDKLVVVLNRALEKVKSEVEDELKSTAQKSFLG